MNTADLALEDDKYSGNLLLVSVSAHRNAWGGFSSFFSKMGSVV